MNRLFGAKRSISQRLLSSLYRQWPFNLHSRNAGENGEVKLYEQHIRRALNGNGSDRNRNRSGIGYR